MAAGASDPRCLLFDNGSLEPAATLQLRDIAHRLQAVIGVEVQPVSLLHSSAIDPNRVGGVPAQVLEPTLRGLLGAGCNDPVLLPLFFGPSAALSEYLPARLERLRRDFPAMRVRVGRWLVDTENSTDTRIAAILGDNIRAVIAGRGLRRPAVVLVDHGSPQAGVTAVRDFLGRQVADLLAGKIATLAVASMERRDGAEYDFCEPTLTGLLRRAEFAAGDVVLAPQFLMAGRHAGLEGDLEKICAVAERRRPGLKIHCAQPVGGHPGLIAVLADRYREMASAPSPGGAVL